MALRYGTYSQGISRFYLHTPRSSADGMNHTYLCMLFPYLPFPSSRRWSLFTDPGRMKSWIGLNGLPFHGLVAPQLYCLLSLCCFWFDFIAMNCVTKEWIIKTKCVWNYRVEYMIEWDCNENINRRLVIADWSCRLVIMTLYRLFDTIFVWSF